MVFIPLLPLLYLPLPVVPTFAIPTFATFAIPLLLDIMITEEPLVLGTTARECCLPSELLLPSLLSQLRKEGAAPSSALRWHPDPSPSAY